MLMTFISISQTNSTVLMHPLVYDAACFHLDYVDLIVDTEKEIARTRLGPATFLISLIPQEITCRRGCDVVSASFRMQKEITK